MNNIQRKFLVSSDIERWIEKYTTTVDTIEQFYVSSPENAECYYCKHFPHTYTKVMVNAINQQEVVTISSEMYISKRHNRIGRVIVKKSYTIIIDEHDEGSYVVEKYFKNLEGIYIFIGNFQNEKAVKDSELLPLLHPFVLKEIDKDEKYSSQALALSVKPMEYSSQKLFEKIDAFVTPNLFFWRVPQNVYVHDGVSLLVYRNIRLINHYKMSFQTKQFSSTLHRLRILLRRTQTLLDVFPAFFNVKVQHYCIDLLKRYYEETKMLRYLYFLNELYATQEDSKLTLYSELKSLIIKEEQSTIEKLSSKPFMQMLDMLIDEIKIPKNKKYILLEEAVKDATRQYLHAFEILLAHTNEGYDDTLLEEIYVSIDTLQTLIEDFFHILGEKKAQKILEALNRLLKPLREYRNCKERAVILSTIKVQSTMKTLDTNSLLCAHEDVLKGKIENALKVLRNSKFQL